MQLSTYVDRLIPPPGSGLDQLSQRAQESIRELGRTPAGRPVLRLLRGNEWLGRPLHPYVVPIPVAAWLAGAWYDRKAARGDAAAEKRADRAVRLGAVGAVLAAATGQAQYVDAGGAARREAAVHAALNNVALGMQLGSLRARSRGRRSLGRALSGVALVTLPISGTLGVDIATRMGVGFQVPALRRSARL